MRYTKKTKHSRGKGSETRDKQFTPTEQEEIRGDRYKLAQFVSVHS